MGAVVAAVASVVEDVVDVVGDVAQDVVDVADTVIETVSENPLLLVAAVAAPEVLAAMSAETGAAAAIEVASAAEAVSTGTAVLEATQSAVTLASSEAVAAEAVIAEAGASAVIEAAEAAQMVSEGATIADAVATTSGFDVSPLVEVAQSTTDVSTNPFRLLSEGATNLTKMIGETLLPEANPVLQKLAGQTAISTVTNGGDFGKALENSLISVGSGLVGGEVAAQTGSKLAGQVAGQALGTIVRGGDLSVEGIGTSLLSNAVGNEVADATGSSLAGRAAASVTRSVVNDQDPMRGLTNLGVNELSNYVSGTISDAVTSPEQVDQFGIPKEPVYGEAPEVTEKDFAKTETTEPAPAEKLPAEVRDLAQTDEMGITAEPVYGEVPEVTSKDFEKFQTGEFAEPSLDTAIFPKEVQDIAESVRTAAPAAAIEAEDVLPSQTVQVETPEGEAPVDLSGMPQAPVMNVPTAGALQTAGLTQDTGEAQKQASGALNQILRPAIQQGISRAIAAPVTRPSARQMMPSVSAARPIVPQGGALKQAASAPPPQKVDVSQLIPIYKPAPKRADVRTLTPITNIAGLSALLKRG